MDPVQTAGSLNPAQCCEHWSAIAQMRHGITVAARDLGYYYRISYPPQHLSMPAKIRKIKGDVTLEDHVTFFDPLGEEARKSIATFEFNKSLNYKGGKLGQFKMSRLSPDAVRIKIKQDLNDDGKFSKDELIYKGTIEEVKDADALLNFEGKIKILEQMNACRWDSQKLSDDDAGLPVSCATLDLVLEYTAVTFKTSGGSTYSFPTYFPNPDAIVAVGANDISTVLGS